MSARGEGAGQPSTSAQGQPAAPAPQKRGRGRPRKQQQVSTQAGWEHQPTSAPSARAPRRAATRARESSRRGRHTLPAGRGAGYGVRCAAEPRGARAPRGGDVGTRGGRPDTGGRWGREQRVLRLSLLCTARSVAVAPGDWKRQGSDNPGLARRFPNCFTIAPEAGSAGRGGGGARVLWGGRVGGAEVLGAVRWLFLPPTPAASGPGLARRSRPLGAFSKFSVARDSRPPDKELVGPLGPLRAL